MEDIDKVKKHFGVEFVESWSDDLDYYVYCEDCVDGYEVTVATNNPNTLVISEDVHYYQSEVPSYVAEAIRGGAKKIYCEELSQINIFDEIAEDLMEDLD